MEGVAGMAAGGGCKYNGWIICAEHACCAWCGWNPETGCRRKERIREARRKVVQAQEERTQVERARAVREKTVAGDGSGEK